MSASAPVPPPAAQPFPWPRCAQLGLAFLLGVLALLVIQHGWQRIGAAGRPATAANWPMAAEDALRLDVNTAKREELLQIPGIGPTLADRIVDYRTKNGPFATLDDLERVHGIGPLLMNRLRPYLTVGGTPTFASSTERSTSNHKSGLIDLNRAGREELMQLPGIGPVLADRILADRQAHGPYRTVHDLTRIKGIKGKTVEKLLPHVYVKEEDVARGRDGA
jgi:competence ComEA-like helix-hairpin-helix protein